MIVGIGTDLCDVRRIQATLSRRGERFAQRVLGEREFPIWQARTLAQPTRGLRYLGTRFAAKEAFSKAIGLGMHLPMTWRHCEVLNDPSGRPGIVLSGALGPWFEARGWRAHVTLTDDGDWAQAFVVVESAPVVASGN